MAEVEKQDRRGRLLFGGGANYSGKDSRDIAGELRPCIEQTFPQLGKLSDNVWYCQGYSGHGIATTHIMGDLLGNPMLAAGMWYYQILERLR